MLASPLQVSPRVSHDPNSIANEKSIAAAAAAAAGDQENLSPSLGKRSPISEGGFSTLLPKKRLKFSTNYCGLESGLSEMDVGSAGGGFGTPTPIDELSIVKNANLSRKRQLGTFASSPPSASLPRLDDNLKMSSLQTLNQSSSQQSLLHSRPTTFNTLSPSSPRSAPRALKVAAYSPRKYVSRPQFCATPSTHSDKAQNDASMDDEPAQAVSVLRRAFEQRYSYRKRLKQLPSQRTKGQGGTEKVCVDDALKIFEEMLADREESLKQEYKVQLEKQLSEQYDQLMKYNEEYVRNQISTSSCSYLS